MVRWANTLSGAIGTGDAVLAAQAGADLAYLGSAFIATEEANAVEGYKQGIVDNGSSDIVYTNLFTGVHGNYLRPSIEAAGLDPDDLPQSDPSNMNFGSGGSAKKKAWKDIWGSGQGINAIKEVLPTSALVGRQIGIRCSQRANQPVIGFRPDMKIWVDADACPGVIKNTVPGR